MSSRLNIFVTGATGFIGGMVVNRLLRHPNASSFHITALVRSAEKGEKFKTLGIEPIIGSYTDDDLKFLVDAASEADVVITAADADNLPAARAILDGLKIRYEKTKKVPILIHTSGSALIIDDARGLHANRAVYSDLDVDKLNGLPSSALHRNVDSVLIEADETGYVNTYIVAPSVVFGKASGPLVDLKIQNTQSISIPLFVKLSLAHKQAGYFGKGLNIWSAVDVGENADLYILIFDSALKNEGEAGHGREGYYFAESTSFNGLEVAQVIADTLVGLGVLNERGTSAFLEEELIKVLGPIWQILAANSVVKGARGRALGWKPVVHKEDLFRDVVSEVKRIVSEQSN